ncbi:aldo-keto reductase family 1 member A1-like [Amphiura filiformis]|uniref:aldo-keto reductase family 1 member A1-like n=1 Tax=Amphiura filiformis TaxID=82378 RepID=UPI003B21157E
MSLAQHTATLHTGAKMPLLGLGTWKSKADEIRDAIVSALQTGYRHLDCAAVYGNECHVGEALKEALALTGIKRSEVFITSKLWDTMHDPDDVLPALKKSLADLQLDYLDLYLIHNPYAFAKKDGQMMPKNPDGTIIYSDVHYCDTWKAMEGLVDQSLCKAIGLSNFNHKQVLDVIDKARIKPAVLQVECNPFFRQEKLIDFCHSHGIVLTAYSPLCCGDRAWRYACDPDLFGDPKLMDIAKKHNKSVAQIALRFQVQRGVVTIPKSVTPKWIEENAQIFDFSLSEDDIRQISSLKTHRMGIPPAKGPDNKPLLDDHGHPIPRDKDHQYYPFNEPF